MLLKKLTNFRQVALTLSLLCCVAFQVAANDYQDAWAALQRNDRAAARSLFQKALKNPATQADAALSLLLMDNFEDREGQVTELWGQAVPKLADPYPYYYAWWFNAGLGGEYGLKSKAQAKWLEKLLEDPKCPGEMKASAQYQLGHYYLTQDEMEDAHKVWAQCGNVTEWQFTGPFDNQSESGFDKDYPPVANAKPDAKFKSMYNSDIQWFTPGRNLNDGWITPTYALPYSTAVIFAQSFVTSPSEQDVYLSVGFTGNSLKVWVNDRLLLAEPEERRSDFDLYRIPCHLKKGVNRVLVQEGNSGSSYVCFATRFTDVKGNLVPGIVSSSRYQAYTPDNGAPLPAGLPAAPEAFFEKKIQQEPDNPLNYYLLVEVYLRSKKAQEALRIADAMVTKAPQSSLFHFQRFQCYSKLENRTNLTEEIQFFKDNDPESLIGLVLRYEEAAENEQWDEASDLLDKREKMYEDFEDVHEERIKVAAKQEKYEEMLKLINDGKDKYPTSPYFARLAHDIEIHMSKDPRAAIKVYENFLKKHYYLNTASALVDDYFKQGMNDKAISMLEKFDGFFKEDPAYARQLYGYYYGQKDNKKARQWLDVVQSIAPYSSTGWENAAQLAEQAGNPDEALANFKKAIHYNPNDYDSRRRIRELEKKPALDTYLPDLKVYDLIKNARDSDVEGEHDCYYVLDQRATIVYPERCSEAYYTVAVKVLNQSGIDRWKESDINYNDDTQRLIIEKAEVVKAKGAKLTAERNGNQLVFPNLEVGDVVLFKYRLITYVTSQRMTREFFDTYTFDGSVPCQYSSYTLLAHQSVPLQFKQINCTYEPVKSTVEDYNRYVWESQKEPARPDEPVMPASDDVAKILYVSSLANWSDVTQWYTDVSSRQAKRDDEVKNAVKKIFPDGTAKLGETAKARAIYEYVVKTIRYSSVPFRQSGLVPQRAAKVLQTKLGDCKDLATLYAAIAREVGLKANLVLVNTRDNGENSLPLPSIWFNHCIVKVRADGKDWLLELTNEFLPFGALPQDDYLAQALEIPFKDETGATTGSGSAQLFQLAPANRVQDFRHSTAEVKVEKRDLSVTHHITLGGSCTVGLRNGYRDISRQKQLEKVQEEVAGHYENPVTAKDLALGNLNALTDTAQLHVRYNVKNEVVEIGELRTFKVPFYFTFLKAGAFPEMEKARTFPVNYLSYEDADHYSEVLTLTAPTGKQFTELPKDVKLSANGIEYLLKYSKTAPDTVRVERDIVIKRANIAAKDYESFRQFVEEVVAAEERYVAFK